MNIYIVGICGTFMAGIAKLASQMGHQVYGCDRHFLPPMSTQLEKDGIQIEPMCESMTDALMASDLVIFGNICSRGMPLVEAILNQGLPYTSGAEWLANHVLKKRKVLCVSGTHGKTTTTALLVWYLLHSGLKPGFLLGGIHQNLGVSVSLGEDEWFVIEADEYDTAFFDKRPKFMHYRPWGLIINNLEYDHADIYPNLEAIIQQFKYLLRTVPSLGHVIYPEGMPSVERALEGALSQRHAMGDTNEAEGHLLQKEQKILWRGGETIALPPSLKGIHNGENALAASLLAAKVGVSAKEIEAALKSFELPKRRMQYLGHWQGVHVYDDFAHHPTAIQVMLETLEDLYPGQNILLIIDLSSQTLRRVVHREALARIAKRVMCLWHDPYQAGLALGGRSCQDQSTLCDAIKALWPRLDVCMVMSSSYLKELMSGMALAFSAETSVRK